MIIRRTLDIGCGYLPSHRRYASKNDVGIDLRRGNADVICDAAHLPFRDNTFTYAYARNVLEHLEKPAKTVREISRVLKKGGTVSISIPIHHSKWIDELLKFVHSFPFRTLTTIKRLQSSRKCRHEKGYRHVNRMNPEYIAKTFKIIRIEKTKPLHPLFYGRKGVYLKKLGLKEIHIHADCYLIEATHP